MKMMSKLIQKNKKDKQKKLYQNKLLTGMS